MSDLVIRDAATDDVTAIAAILNREIAETTATWTIGVRNFTDMRAWFQNRRGAGYPVLVADLGGRVLGYGALGPFRDGEGYRRTAEHSVYVASAARRRGAGRALLRALIDRARADGFHAMVGGIGAENEESLILHRKLGFEETGRLPEVGWKFDRPLDLVFMQMLL